ncbi:hypothetical protein OPQ81_000085 [Rhizoctonia solani]|nr:hypothetical protein OPQ81_000085 [Rhizoctonia solani]
MKRDDQILPLRLQNEANRDRIVQTAKDRDRERALNPRGEVPLLAEDVPEEIGAVADEDGAVPVKNDASYIIVIHPGSQNLRIGFASDALPKTIPMTLATRFPQTESEQYEALPRRQFEAKTSEEQYGEDWSKKYTKQSSDLKIDMRANKRKVLPNSKELVVNYNRRADPEIIPVHNDPLQVEWTDVRGVPDDSNPKFKLWWPMQCGWLNEDDYTSKEHLYDDFETLLDKAIRQELGLNKNSAWKQYSCVFVIPDLYDKRYVEQALRSCMNWFEFSKVCFIQESMAATFGAGYTQACVVDVGAQKTSITCVEDGLCLEDSRINLKYGGYDVTETFIKMMLFDNFPYADINLRRRHDFLLAEELKIKHCTMTQAEISVQLFQFHLRAPNQPTRKYQFKTCAAAGRSSTAPTNPYEVEVPDDPLSAAQTSILALSKPSINQLNLGVNGTAPATAEFATPMKEKPNPFNNIAPPPVPPPFVFGGGAKENLNGNASPAPNGGTPAPTTNGFQPQIQATPAPQGMFVDPSVPVSKLQAMERDSVLPIAPLDTAIMTSIQHAAKGDEKKTRDLMGSIMVIGGGAKIPHFTSYLEERLRARRPDIADRVLVSRSAGIWTSRWWSGRAPASLASSR